MKLFIKFTLLLIPLTISLLGCASLFTINTSQDAIYSRTIKEIWKDNNIKLEIAGLNNKASLKGQVRVTGVSYNGTVVLLGQAKNQKKLDDFKNRVKKIPGITQIHNQVKIKNPLFSIKQVGHDAWITLKVKAALLINAELNGMDTKVMTEDKEVFLFGFVSRKTADTAANIARNVSGVKRVIRAFQYLDK
ncbi:25 kDa hemolysin [Candidatus Photodesmus blepharus]|uniref:25 kDa hemolysin n=1 Tax=Candidatus Photodesmus blepharonis TaxID=1179155 RepID=A0A084CMQ3_9GAMM|nr:BON domain-containing protein [Candidatus Photodesmus blepharus]KEY91082.1 25 kDa hemolysin [Candidatus Photodesmus blepharus]